MGWLAVQVRAMLGARCTTSVWDAPKLQVSEGRAQAEAGLCISRCTMRDVGVASLLQLVGSKEGDNVRLYKGSSGWIQAGQDCECDLTMCEIQVVWHRCRV